MFNAMEEIDPEVNHILSTFPNMSQNVKDNRKGIATHIPSGSVVWVHDLINEFASIELVDNRLMVVELSTLQFNSK